MQRVENQELIGYTATHVLSEVAHRLMILEAAGANGWPYARAKQRLQQQPALLQSLTQFRAAIATVLNSRLHVLTIPPTLIDAAAAASQTHGLLSSDALIVAVMHVHGITNLASGDSDFDRVPGLTRYAPL